jgi:hypothetical protein
MFRNDGYFTKYNARTHAVEWFFQTREGIQGPYPSEAIARETRAAYVASCLAWGITGGRTGRNPPPMPGWRRSSRQLR